MFAGANEEAIRRTIETGNAHYYSRSRGSIWKIVRRDNGKVVEFEEVKYGMLMMVLCDR